MKKNAKRLFAVILSLAMVCGSMLTVNAASTTRFGEYGGGSYSTNLTIQTDRNYVSASVSCSPESPSDVYNRQGNVPDAVPLHDRSRSQRDSEREYREKLK